jgi:uncharacterized protein YdhG (YjbR/CyaY superfamily)
MAEPADQPYTDVDGYIATFPPHTQEVLRRLRATMHQVLPHAAEAIRYRIPTMQIGGKNVVHFAAFTHHVGVYPVPTGDAAFQEEQARYRAGKGTVRFPLDEPVPYDFVQRLVGFLCSERGIDPNDS